MTHNIDTLKNRIRQEIKQAKSYLSEPQKKKESEQVLKRLTDLDCFKKARTILLYHSLPDEVETTRLIEEWCGIKQFILPVVKGDNLILRKYRPECLSDGCFGIQEPDETNENVEIGEIDIAVIPGIAFDRDGNRLGRGKGYYDRLLEESDIPKIGICFRIQLIDKVPADRNDRRMNKVITADEVIDCRYTYNT